VHVNTNQTGGAMSYGRDNVGANPSVNYEPSSTGGLQEADESYREYRPWVEGQIMRAPIERENNYGQVGLRWRNDMDDVERDDLVLNLVTMLGQCEQHIQERMVAHLTKCDDEYGRRVAEGLGLDRSKLDIEGLVKVR
jgi:catalase